MSEIYKFPNGGYDVTVHKKQDIIDCINENIIDKEVALAIVERCEIDAANFITQGKWTGLPFIGNVRIPKIAKVSEDEEKQSIINTAKECLDNDQYVMFRRQFYGVEKTRIEFERYYKYMISIAVTKNKKLYRTLCKTKGEVYARLVFFARSHVVAVDNRYEIITRYEQQADNR